jgi:hypothetical protein
MPDACSRGRRRERLSLHRQIAMLVLRKLPKQIAEEDDGYREAGHQGD